MSEPMTAEPMTPEQALREIVGGVPHPAVIIAELETAYGYTITRIDPEAAAVAELLALERAGTFVSLFYTEHYWFAHMRREPGSGDFVKRAETAVELLAAVKAKLATGKVQ